MEMAGHSSSDEKATQIVFFDLETTVPRRTRQKFCVLEFGAIVVCPRTLVELESYCTLIRPKDLSVVSLSPGRIDGINRKEVTTAPMLEDVADNIYNILHGRIWAGHNIQRFDSARIREVFADLGRAPPTPIGMIDSLNVLTQKFGRRAGNMKVCSSFLFVIIHNFYFIHLAISYSSDGNLSYLLWTRAAIAQESRRCSNEPRSC